MTTQTDREAITYSRIVTHLLALRQEVLGTSREEAGALDRIVSKLVALQVYEGPAGRGQPGAASN